MRRRNRIAREKGGRPEFDREGFYLGVGVGGGTLAVGLLLGWATLTMPEGATGSSGHTTAQRLARLLPNEVQSWIALVMAGLFVLFGTVVLAMGLWTVVRYVVERLTASRSQ
ncbi:MAG: hypothetical protein H7840_10240 [Alphaproteobacteria bacterium]